MIALAIDHQVAVQNDACSPRGLPRLQARSMAVRRTEST
jgi:hypothetical protein